MIQRTRIVSRLIGRLLPHKIASLVRFYKPSMLVKPTGKRSYFVNQRRDQSPKAIQALRSSKNIFLPHLHNNSHLRPLLFPPEHRPSSAIQLRSLLPSQSLTLSVPFKSHGSSTLNPSASHHDDRFTSFHRRTTASVDPKSHLSRAGCCDISTHHASIDPREYSRGSDRGDRRVFFPFRYTALSARWVYVS